MRKYIYILLTVLLAGCEYIPFDQHYIAVGKQPLRSRALLVEFTGRKCSNCPTAAETAHHLLEEYGDSLVVVAMHPEQSAFCQSKKPEYDYTCEAAGYYFEQMGGTASVAFPKGVVNMTSSLLDYAQWATYVQQATTTAAAGTVHIEVESVTDRTLSLQLTASSDQPEKLQLAVWLTEDSIVGPQVQPEGNEIMTYVHNHMLRAEIYKEPAQTEVHFTYDFPETFHNQAIRMEHCTVVAVLMREKDMQVLDVEQKAIIRAQKK